MRRLDQFTLSTLLADGRRRGLRGALIIGLRYLSRRFSTKENRKFDFWWDEHLSWLKWAVPGMLEDGNVGGMAYALQHLPDKASAIVEIGSFGGLSTCILGYLREKFGVANPLYNCDRWEFEFRQMGEPVGGLAM